MSSRDTSLQTIAWSNRHNGRKPHSPTSISSIPFSIPSYLSEHSPKKKLKHRPHQNNRNRIVPSLPPLPFPREEKAKAKDRGTLRIALKCHTLLIPPDRLFPNYSMTESREKGSRRRKRKGTHNLRNGSPIGNTLCPSQFLSFSSPFPYLSGRGRNQEAEEGGARGFLRF